MSTCGYVCPACNNSGFDEQGLECHWCQSPKEQLSTTSITDEEWLKTVHEGPCCSDIGPDKDQ